MFLTLKGPSDFIAVKIIVDDVAVAIEEAWADLLHCVCSFR
jgi:hypothetical protein